MRRIYYVFIYVRIYFDSALVRGVGFKLWLPAPLTPDCFHHPLVASLIGLIRGGETVTR